MDSQKWASAQEDVTEGDLGLGKVAHLDICTGTAICSTAGDKASAGDVEGTQSLCTHFQTCTDTVPIYLVKYVL